MSQKEYVFYFTPEREDRFRYYHDLVRGEVMRFAVQYEAFIDGRWHPIVRYDTAHGFPHKDIMFPDGSQEKIHFLEYTFEEVLTLGERDIKMNWQEYRLSYERKM